MTINGVQRLIKLLLECTGRKQASAATALAALSNVEVSTFYIVSHTGGKPTTVHRSRLVEVLNMSHHIQNMFFKVSSYHTLSSQSGDISNIMTLTKINNLYFYFLSQYRTPLDQY